MINIPISISKEIDSKLFHFYDSVDKKIIMHDYSNVERKYIHNRCDQLRLFHHSENVYTPYAGRVVIVSKPNNFNNSINNSIGEIKEDPRRKRRKIECDLCMNEYDRDELFVHWGGLGPYCEECIEDDEELRGHKWECLD